MADNSKALRGGGSTGRKPGPKPGQRHSGQFRKGHDPRRWLLGPRRGQNVKDLERLCRESAEDALRLLLDTVNDEDAPRRDRLAAAREILDRGYGKPVDRQAILNLNGGGDSPAELTREQLERIAAGAFERESGQVIDLHPERGPK